MNITVLGAGYVGLTLAAVLSDFGHRVWVVRKDSQKNEALKNGQVHFFEPGLEALVKKNLASGRLCPTTDYQEAVPHSEIVFIAVGTPSLSSGEMDITQVFESAAEVGRNLRRGYTLIVNKSTVPPGTTWKVSQIIQKNKKRPSNFEISFCPEFLREGSAVQDTLHPDRVVIGTETPRAARILKQLHQPFGAPILQCRITSAELIKYTANAYLALRIVFINQIADLCEKIGADVEEVVKGIGLDKRIGSHYWYPGLGYGGSCFPKDVAGLAFFADKKGMEDNLFTKMHQLNKARIDKTLKRISEQFVSLKGKVVGVLGLACKQGTDDVRKSPAMDIVRALLKKGVRIQAYDPLAMENAKRELEGVKFCANPYQVAEKAEALLILTDWPEFKKIDLRKIKKAMKKNFIFDSRNLLAKEQVAALGFNYLSVGR